MKPRPEKMKGMVGEARLQAHLGVMQAQDKVGPYVTEVAHATEAAAADVAKRVRALKAHLKALKTRR